jgi:CheY-like chemotaxis protein
MEPQPGALLGLDVLVVEDDAHARAILRDLFRFFGARVTVAATAREGLRALRQGAPDVVVADMRLPDHNATWLLREARTIPRTAPFIAVTAYTFEERTLRAQGFATLLRKPLSQDDLVNAVLAAAPP